MAEFSIDVSTADFEEKVLAASHRALVLVDFWAAWCSPCRVLKPVLEKLATDYGGRFILAKVDSDRNHELSARFGVRGIPNVKAFVNGKQVDEFTGALPEAQVRAFIERLLPSPAEPLRAAAQAARADKDYTTARALLDDAAALAPGHQGVLLDRAEIALDLGETAAAQELLATLDHIAEDKNRHQALLARAALLASGGSANPAALREKLASDPGDQEIRLQLANALALAGDYRAALDELLEMVRRDRAWNEQAARRRMLDLFALLGSEPANEDVVRDYRVRLARTLN